MFCVAPVLAIAANLTADPDSFSEKLITGIIKNLQVQVKDIHIRYEDEFTNPDHPFVVGVSLRSLDFKVIELKPCLVLFSTRSTVLTCTFYAAD